MNAHRGRIKTMEQSSCENQRPTKEKVGWDFANDEYTY